MKKAFDTVEHHICVYINTLADRINSLECGVHIDDFRLSLLLYADDIALIAPDKESLQRMLNVVTEWCAELKLSVNIGKTKFVHFRPQSFLRSDFTFRCSGKNIDYIDSYKYLGVWMDEHLTFVKHAKELTKAASRALGALITKTQFMGGMTFKVYNKL
ncbi:Hypothetical predicted protein [Mytilus galloprovincialis]|uniref:Reverse transcriptase domain-containing protein n=1 Tax=Mytilus galloprovincialis TaxID=29158 RepID=A0A8B6EZ35_MYTGA|nr:Hypothetical predicted protein [Mytilus galloprovincialis]